MCDTASTPIGVRTESRVSLERPVSSAASSRPVLRKKLPYVAPASSHLVQVHLDTDPLWRLYVSVGTVIVISVQEERHCGREGIGVVKLTSWMANMKGSSSNPYTQIRAGEAQNMAMIEPHLFLLSIQAVVAQDCQTKISIPLQSHRRRRVVYRSSSTVDTGLIQVFHTQF